MGMLRRSASEIQRIVLGFLQHQELCFPIDSSFDLKNLTTIIHATCRT